MRDQKILRKLKNRFGLLFPSMAMKANYVSNIMSTDPHKVFSIKL